MTVLQFQIEFSLKRKAPVAQSDKSVRKRMSDPIGLDMKKSDIES
jgi:hypothetical protein